MIIGHEDGFAIGRGRYGGRQNAADEDRKIMQWLDAHRKELSDLSDLEVIKKAVAAGFDSDAVNRVAYKLFNANLECPKSGCGKSFDDKGQLQRHLMGAHGVEREIARARAEGVADPGRENAAGCGQCGTMPAKRYMVDGQTKLLCAECAAKMGGTLLNSDPIARHENARAAGQERYGSRRNDAEATSGLKQQARDIAASKAHLSEDEYERRIERFVDRLDGRLMAHEITQAEYDKISDVLKE